ncbi:unnamed protein product [Mytilus edulis]|uniref:Uncharacterized protein n=1 Tax=Mytilus edulis TaxID=6550 RepID=A0A8S3T5M3_MYTED|nr:unnamed protein product [Mytilus edulis]
MSTRCSDTNEEISNFNRPRGKGGVAIAWKRFLTPSICEIPSGNNRIIAIELKPPMKICIICVYMPTNNSGDSYLENTESATAAVPSKIIKLKGPHFKASPTTLMLLKTSKEKYQLWKSHGKKNDHLKTDKILAQRNLRKQLRKEQYMDRTQFYNELMDNPSNDMFHKLIRRNRGSKNKDAICIIENGEHHYSAKDQTNSFSRYFEDLAVPKDNGYDPEFLDLCNIRHNIFDELCKQSSDEPQFSFQNICDAINQLHSGKATDELGLAAEHFKNSPTTVTHFLTNFIGTKHWSKQFKGHLDLIKLIVDSSFLLPLLRNRTELDKIQRLATDMCYRLHAQRVWKLQGK